MEELLKNLKDHISRYGHARIYLQELDLLVKMNEENEKLKPYPYQYNRLKIMYEELESKE